MKAFTYERPESSAAAVAAVAKAGAKFIAGGTNLLDLMKLEIETPAHLIDINGLGLNTTESTPDGGVRIGAMVRNADLAADPRIRDAFHRQAFLPLAPGDGYVLLARNAP